MTAWVRVASWWASLALIACTCLWSLADRLAGQGLLLHLPTPLLTGGQALTARATLAAEEGDRASAVALSRAALGRRPVDAAALRTAAFAALIAGDLRHGGVLMRLAGAAGWRDRPTQLYWADAALDAGAPDVAAERLDAVERVAPDARARAILLRLEATRLGRAALIERWGEPNAWHRAYLVDVDGLTNDGLAARLATIALARATGIGLDRAALDRIGWALIERGRADLAYTFATRRGLVRPFAPASASRAGPFDWAYRAVPGLEAEVASRGGELALHVVATGPALLPVASQLLRLPLGPARLRITVNGAKTPLPIIATLACLGGETMVAEPLPSTAGRLAARLDVPMRCATQRLVLSVAGEEARRGADLWISAVSVTPSAAAVP